MTTLWIGDLCQSWGEAQLNALFADARYGFLEFLSHEYADLALREYNGRLIPGFAQVFRLNWGAPGVKLNQPEVSLFIGDLASSINDVLLFNAFSEHYPSTLHAKVMMDTVTGCSRGYGFVKFGDYNEAKRAIIEMNGVKLNGREIRVSTAQKRCVNNVMYMMNEIDNNNYMIESPISSSSISSSSPTQHVYYNNSNNNNNNNNIVYYNNNDYYNDNNNNYNIITVTTTPPAILCSNNNTIDNSINSRSESNSSPTSASSSSSSSSITDGMIVNNNIIFGYNCNNNNNNNPNDFYEVEYLSPIQQHQQHQQPILDNCQYYNEYQYMEQPQHEVYNNNNNNMLWNEYYEYNNRITKHNQQQQQQQLSSSPHHTPLYERKPTDSNTLSELMKLESI